MAKFMYVFRGGAVATQGVSPTELQGHLAKWTAWLGALGQQGVLLPGGQRLQNTGRLLRGRDASVTDGPYAESKDLITGSIIVEVASLDLATEIARGCPIFEYEGSLEVRPVFEQGM
jgi:hypothetical protein